MPFKSGIVDAYLKGTALRQQKEGQDKDRELRAKALEQQHQEFQEQLKLNEQRFKAQQLMDEANFKLHQQGVKLQVADSLAKGTLAGETQGDTTSINDPNLGKISAPSLEAQTKRKAALLAPEIEAQVKKVVESYKSLSPLKNADAVEATKRETESRKTLLGEKAKYDEQLLAKRQAGEEKLARIRQEGAMKIAQLHESGANSRAAMKLAEDGQDETAALNTTFDELISGSLSAEELVKRGYSQKQRVAISQHLARNKMVVPSTQMVKDLKAFATLSSIYKEAEELTTLINESGLGTKIASKIGFDTQPKVDLERLSARAIQLSRDLSGERGAMTEGDARRAGQFIARIGLGPNAKANNLKTLNSLREALAVKQRSIMGKMPEEQRLKVMETYGMPDFKSVQIPGEFE